MSLHRSHTAPLADRMRPNAFHEVLGQDHLTGPGRLLPQALATDLFPSIIFWGPPGSGKTTLAHIIAQETKKNFVALSAVLSGVKEVRAIIDQAQAAGSHGIIIFVDEIHRFNKSQQDAFLPHVENGTVILIGATTENPSFSLTPALLSRCRVAVLKPLHSEQIEQLLKRSLTDEQRGLGSLQVRIEDEVLKLIAQQADGDVRYALNMLEAFVQIENNLVAKGEILTRNHYAANAHRRTAIYDKAGDGHFNLISAFHKSLRGSDVDAALYWLARMLTAGEDGLYIARRMVRFASEDIGNADPMALSITLQAKEAYHFLGPPEGELALTQAAIYLATAPKSNSVYKAYQQAMDVARNSGSLSPPRHLLNAPTQLMRHLGYGENYRYPHDYENAFVVENYMPVSLETSQFYHPIERGFERDIARRMAWWQKIRQQARQDGGE